MRCRPTSLLLLALAGLAAIASPASGAQNMPPNQALTTAMSEKAIAITEAVIGEESELRAKFGPVKDGIRKAVQGGSADMGSIIDPLTKFVNENEPKYRGLASAMRNAIGTYQWQLSTIDPAAMEASWDYLYYVYKVVGTKIKNPAILKKLEALNEELEGDFPKKPSAKDVAGKVSKFLTEAESLSSGFEAKAHEQMNNDAGTFNANGKLPTTPAPPTKIEEETPKPTEATPKPTESTPKPTEATPKPTEATPKPTSANTSNTTVPATAAPEPSSKASSGSGSSAPSVDTPSTTAPKATTAVPKPTSAGSTLSLTVTAVAAIVAVASTLI